MDSQMTSEPHSSDTGIGAGREAAPDYRRARVLKRLTKRMVPGLNTEDTQE